MVAIPEIELVKPQTPHLQHPPMQICPPQKASQLPRIELARVRREIAAIEEHLHLKPAQIRIVERMRLRSRVLAKLNLFYR